MTYTKSIQIRFNFFLFFGYHSIYYIIIWFTVGSHDDEDDDIFDVPTAKGQHINTLLCINIGICIFILVGVLISLKENIKKVGCKLQKKNVSSIRKIIFKRKKINRPNVRKLPSASEIELNRMQFAISSENDWFYIWCLWSLRK